MMESSNLNLDLHHQDDFHGSSSSSLALPSLQDLIQNSEFSDGMLSSSRDHFMMQELGFQWGPTSNLQDYNLMPSHVKHEFNQINGFVQPSFEPMNLGVNNIGRSLSMVLPSANILSSSSMHPLYPSSSLGMDLQALDLLAASARFGKPMSQPSLLNNMALLREDLAYGTLGQLQEQTDHVAVASSASHCKVSHSASRVTEARRSNSLDCGTPQPTTKKPRFMSPSSFTPFKVRKEKLGDRIAALQQLVAPFGKTDTASVLMEAIGYIKFLQDQVETLSVPYMRSSNNNKTRASQEVPSEETDEAKPDLRSRGLCLVPLSCMSYVTNENGGVWSPNSNYRGGS